MQGNVVHGIYNIVLAKLRLQTAGDNDPPDDNVIVKAAGATETGGPEGIVVPFLGSPFPHNMHHAYIKM